MDFPKSEAHWIAQLSSDPSVLGRAEAARALGKIGGPAVTVALANALPGETFWHVQGEIAQALGQIRTPAAVDALLRAHRGVAHPKARRALLAALGEVKTPEVRAALSESAGSEKSYFAQTQALRSLAKQGDAEARPVLDRALRQDSWNDVIRSGALEALTALRPDDLVPVLKRHTAYGVPHTRRMAAIRCLAQVGVGRDDVRKHLQELLKDDYLLVQLAAVRALTHVGDERAIPALEALTRGHRDGRLIRTAEESVTKLKKNIEDK